jgi:hypothetical protein
VNGTIDQANIKNRRKVAAFLSEEAENALRSYAATIP